MTEHLTGDRELISRNTVASLTGLTIDTIKWHRTHGKMPAPDYVVDNKPLWFKETIDLWIAQKNARKRSLVVPND